MKEQKIVPIRMDNEMHRELRKLAFLTELPMAHIVRQGIQMRIDEIKKALTSRDIAI
jgi:predicted DNA-binding protein